MSAAARARIAAAQRKRWAAVKKTGEPKGPAAPSQAAKPKRRLSAAGKKAIIEGTKRRWARVKAEADKAAKAERAPAKKASSKTAGRKNAKRAAKAEPTPQTTAPVATE